MGCILCLFEDTIEVTIDLFPEIEKPVDFTIEEVTFDLFPDDEKNEI